MAHRFKNIDRDTPLLLPPDLRDWITEDDLVHFVIRAVDRLPLSGFSINDKGTGSEQYPPHLMLALLIYCYANGIFSSRRIERATYRDIGVRYLCGNSHPDHDSICKFRRENFAAVAAAFVQVLELAKELKLLKLGVVSLDGTHIKANASKDKNVTYQRAQELRRQLQADVQQLLEQAEVADQKKEDAQKLPDEIARRENLWRKMDQACAQLEARAAAQAAEEPTEDEPKPAGPEENHVQRLETQSPKGTPDPNQQINLTDEDSKVMRKSKRDGFTQSYNCQAVVDAEGTQLIVGSRISKCSADNAELEPDLDSIPQTLGRPTAVLADCGFVSKETFQRLNEKRPDLNLYVSVHREDAHRERKYEFRPVDKIKPVKKLVHPVLIAMAEKLKTPEGQAIYRKRAMTVEPVFGILKGVLGFRQFLLRGLKKVTGEWNLACVAWNCKRLHRLMALHPTS